MKEAVEILAKNYDKSTTDKSLVKYKDIVEKHRYNPLLSDYVSEQYRPTRIEVGTFGAYLWGCSQNYYGNVNKNCSALCTGSLDFKLNENVDMQTCQYQIWTYDKELKLETPKISSSRAYIYVPEDWNSFKKSDIEKLKNVDFASVLTTKESKHTTIISMTAIENLPISEKSETVLKSSRSNIFYYILFIFLIVILAIFYKYKN
jgi:hypothetical protein